MARGDQVQINLTDLVNFQQRLHRYNRELEASWQTLQRAYTSLSSSWVDIKKEDFDSKVGWADVQRMKEGYLRTCAEYEAFLNRIRQHTENFLGT